MRLLTRRKYIKDVLRYKTPLSIEEKAPTFLTTKNYINMEELFGSITTIITSIKDTV